MRVGAKRNLVWAVLSAAAMLLAVVVSGCERVPANPNDPASESYLTATPSLDLTEGTYHADVSVNISCSDEDAVIYYTTDNTQPTTSSSTYSGPVPVGGHGTATTVRAIAQAPDFYPSAEATAVYQIEYRLLTVENDGQGTTTPAGAVRVADGAATTITAVSSDEGPFIRWAVVSGTGATIADTSAATTTITLAGDDAEIRAEFGVQYSLTILTSGIGTVSPSGTIAVYAGEETAISATGGLNYRFLFWSTTSESGVVFGDVMDPSTTVTLNEGDATITAHFVYGDKTTG